jgi:uncharacterized cupredoxin-like copper-binding protein
MRRFLVVAGVVGVAALAGCGGDDNKDSSTKSAAPASSSSSGSVVQTVNVTETEFKLDPANPRISKPGEVEFKVKNDGQTQHTIEVEGPGGEKELEPVLDPGKSGTLKVNLDKAGRFEWYCPVGNHKDLGMKGVITVAGSTAASGGSTTETQKTDTTETNTTETTQTNSGGDDSGGSGSGGSSNSGSGGGSSY